MINCSPSTHVTNPRRIFFGKSLTGRAGDPGIPYGSRKYKSAINRRPNSIDGRLPPCRALFSAYTIDSCILRFYGQFQSRNRPASAAGRWNDAVRRLHWAWCDEILRTSRARRGTRFSTRNWTLALIEEYVDTGLHVLTFMSPQSFIRGWRS